MSTMVAQRKHQRHSSANGHLARRRASGMSGARTAMTLAPAVMYARKNPIRAILLVTAGLGAAIGLMLTRRLFRGR